MPSLALTGCVSSWRRRPTGSISIQTSRLLSTTRATLGAKVGFKTSERFQTRESVLARGVLLCCERPLLPRMVGATFTGVAGALAAKDVQYRKRELNQRELRQSLHSRGAILERIAQISDHRPLPDLVDAPSLQRTAAYVEHREKHKHDRMRSSYLTESQPRPRGKVKKPEDEPPTPAQLQRAVHARTKSLIADMQRDSLRNANQMAARLDAKQVFNPLVNRTRAYSEARRVLYRSASLDELKEKAADQITTGFVPRSEAAAAAAAIASGGSTKDMRASQLLLGRLELLDEKLHEEYSANPTSKPKGMAARRSSRASLLGGAGGRLASTAPPGGASLARRNSMASRGSMASSAAPAVAQAQGTHLRRSSSVPAKMSNPASRAAGKP